MHTSAGVDVNATYHNQQTPLHLAAAKGVEAACRVLIELRANVNARGYCSYASCTALYEQGPDN